MTAEIRSEHRPLLALGLAASLAACAAPGIATQRIDARNDRSPVGMSLDNRDFEQAAQALVRSMMESDRLPPRPDGQPRVMAISRITNDTTLRINTNELLQTVRRELSNSGRIVTSTAVGLDGPSDPMAMQARQLRQSGEFNQRTVAGGGQMVAPDVSLSGQIIQRTVRVDGGAQRVDYNFQLTLTNIRTGIAIWEGQEVISRLGDGRTVSW
jgi:penicillin-binding protein activator